MRGLVDKKLAEFNIKRQLKAIVREAQKEAKAEMAELQDAQDMAEKSQFQLERSLEALHEARDVATEQAAAHWDVTHAMWESRVRPLASSVVLQANSVKSAMEVVWQAQLLLNERLRDAETGTERRQRSVQASIVSLGIDSSSSLARLANTATRSIGKGVSTGDYIRSTALARSKIVDLQQIVPTATQEASGVTVESVIQQLHKVREAKAEQEAKKEAEKRKATAVDVTPVMDLKHVLPTTTGNGELNLVALLPVVGASILAILFVIVMMVAPSKIPTITLPRLPTITIVQPQQEVSTKPVAAPAPAPASVAAKPQKDWDYRDIQQWSRDNEWMCSNVGDQSPINVDLSQIADDCEAVPSLEYFEGASRPFSRVDLKVVVNKHAWEVAYPVEDGPSIKFGGVPYKLVQFHFHTPSEHTINGKFSDMEVHLVHKSAEGKLLVIGSMLDADANGSSNEFLDQFWNRFPLGRTAAETQQFDNMDPYKGLLTNRNNFLTWEGSLTTPPCTNGVRWVMMKSPTYISTKQLQKYRGGTLTVPENQLVVKPKIPSGVNPETWDTTQGWSNRPVQPLGERKICSAKRQ